MSTNHSHIWWRAAILGAANGILFGSAAEILRGMYTDYRERQIVESFKSLDMTPPLMVDLLHWWAIPLWATAFFIPVSVLVHKFWADRVKSPLVLWQVIGIAGVSAWLIFWQTVARIGGPPVGQDSLISGTLWGDWVVCLVLIIAVNLIYGSIIQLSVSLYAKSKFS